MLVYGDSGVGKTTLAATACDVEEMRDVLYIDAEAGSLSLVGRKDLHLVSVRSYRQVNAVYEYLRLCCQYRDNDDMESLRALQSKVTRKPVQRPHVYRTVVIDSLSEIYRYIMYQVQGVRFGDKTLAVDIPKAQWDDWGKTGDLTRYLVRSFRDLPLHVIVVAAAMIFEDDNRVHTRRPDFPGKLSMAMPYFMDVVGYMTIAAGEEGKTVRRLYLSKPPNNAWQAKHRFQGQKVDYLDDPTMGHIMALAKAAVRK